MRYLHNSRKRPTKRAVRRKEAGYAYLMALFMVLTVIIASQVMLRNMVTEARSQRESEAIWRGNQYVRAIKMYYRKTGHFPQSQDDLLTGQPGIHFLRSEVVNDPMNKTDGKWRFIYTNGSGAIIGSVKYGNLTQMALMDMNGGVMPGTQNASGNSNSNSSNTSGQNSSDTSLSNSTTPGSNAAPAGANGGLGQAGLFPPQTGQAFGSPGGQSPATATSPFGAQTGNAVGPPPTGPVDSPVFGGQIIGVGSTVDFPSVRVYKGGKKYKDWEFIWNPLEEQAQAVQGLVSGAGTPGLGLGGSGLPLGPMGGGPPTNGAGTNTSNGTGGTTNSPTPTQ